MGQCHFVHQVFLYILESRGFVSANSRSHISIKLTVDAVFRCRNPLEMNVREEGLCSVISLTLTRFQYIVVGLK